jgi:CheY-like chemotaxis protein
LATLSGGIAHELNNVLGVISILSATMEQKISCGQSVLADVEEVLAAAQRGGSITRSLLDFARPDVPKKRRVIFNAQVDSAVRILTRTAPKNVVIETALAEGLPLVECDPSQITHAVMNLCLNAVDAIRHGGRLALQTSAYDHTGDMAGLYPGLEPGLYVRLDVIDNGTGMAAETQRRAFEPFFTTKSVGRGPGLGLAVAYGIVQRHAGCLHLESQPGAGTRASMFLPAIAERRTGMRYTLGASDTDTFGSRGVLLVDDERMIRSAGKSLLEMLGHTVHVAEGGREALELYGRYRDAIDVVLLDLSMPEMDGAAVMAELKRINPDLPIVICTGYPSESEYVALLGAGAAALLQKPFGAKQLVDAIRKALGGE